VLLRGSYASSSLAQQTRCKFEIQWGKRRDFDADSQEVFAESKFMHILEMESKILTIVSSIYHF
jgi:hypothetical protein